MRMATITNINNAPLVNPENAEFLAIKDRKVARVNLVDYIKKNFGSATSDIKNFQDKCSSSITDMEKKFETAISEINEKLREMETAFAALNSVTPVEDVATEETTKKTKKSKK